MAPAPTTALAVRTPPPCVSRPRRPTILCAAYPCSQGPTFLGCEEWPGDIKASGIPEDTQVSTAAAGTASRGGRTEGWPPARAASSCTNQQACLRESQPEKHSQCAWRRPGTAGSWQLLAGTTLRTQGRDHSAARSPRLTDSLDLLPSAGDVARLLGAVPAPGLHQGFPNAAPLGAAALCPWGSLLQPRPQEEPVSFCWAHPPPCLWEVVQRVQAESLVATRAEPSGGSRGRKRSLQDKPVTTTHPNPAHVARVAGEGAVLAQGHVAFMS